MQTLIRILVILSVSGLVALGMYAAVQNESVRGLLRVPAANAQAMRGTGPGEKTGQSFDGTMPPGGAHGEHGGEGQNSSAAGIVQNLAIFGGMLIGVMTIQQITTYVSRRKKTKLVRHAA